MFKKLLTLAAVAALGFSAQAKEVVDAEIDYSKETEIRYFGWGAAQEAKDRITLEDGMFHFHSDSVTDPGWACQFHIIGGVQVQVGVKYTLTLMIKGDPAGSASCHFAGISGWGWLKWSTEWEEVSIDYEATEESGAVLIQCGDFVGDYWVKWIKITHEEGEDKTVWENIITDEKPCLYAKLFDGRNPDGSEKAQPAPMEPNADGVYVINSKGFDPYEYPSLIWTAEEAAAAASWEGAVEGQPKGACEWQNQVWIQAPRAMQDGETFRVSFKAKSTHAFKAGTQYHKEQPGNYGGGVFDGGVALTNDWNEYVFSIASAPANGDLWSLCMNLGTEKSYTKDFTVEIKDIKWELPKLEEGFFIAGDFNDKVWADAIEMKWDDEEEYYVAIVGTAEKPAEVIRISTRRGNDGAFMKNCIGLSEDIDPEETDKAITFNYGVSKNITLPKASIWKVFVDADYKDVDVKTYIWFEDIASSIKAIAIDKVADNAIYNVYGQRVNENYKGVVIKNGKKYLNK